MTIHDLETPALLIDVDVMERNLQRVAGYAREHGLRLRPHTKTHKIPALARRQLELGAAGIAVAKVSEAEVMIDSGTPDLLIAYPVLGASKLDRLVSLAARTRVTVAVDSLEAARPMAEAARRARVEIGVLAETDVGLGRMGVPPGPQLVELVRGLSGLPGLRWEGVTFYPGHIRNCDAAGRTALADLNSATNGLLAALRSAGFKPPIVSGGSTPTLFESHLIEGLTEIRPGTYIFNDRNTVLSGACLKSDCAASILCTVVSTARPGRMMIDGGSKTFSSDRPGHDGEATFGELIEAPQARFFRMNEEHGYVDLPEGSPPWRVGDRLRVIPNHICVAVNLHERIYGVRGEAVIEEWKVEARGKLQ
jgi:D-serine deaminase-like pyridoxal phosphate-dependent protein